MLDLFCGRFGWGKAFAARGWEVVGVDLVEPAEVPHGCTFIQRDILTINNLWEPWLREFAKCSFVGGSIDAAPDVCDACGRFASDECHIPFNFVCASSPCEEFSVFEMEHFHKFPPYPDTGIRLFNHTRKLCYYAKLPFVMENVRGAQHFVGEAIHHCGPFYLWGNAVPLLMAQGIKKGIDVGSSKAVKGMTKEEKRIYRAQFPWNQAWSSSKQRKRDTAKAAEIPPELANCVADYAERLLEVTR